MSTLNDRTAKIGMICKTTTDGDTVVIYRILNHKYAEVADLIGDQIFCEGDRVRLDELVFTGQWR